MNLQRVMAMVMMTLSGGALALMSGRWAGPAVLWIIALAALPGRWTLPLRKTLRLILRLMLALGFAAVSQMVNQDPTGSLAVSALSMIYVTPLYFLTLMAMELFLRYEGPLPSAMVLYATIVMIFAGGLSLERGVVSYLESGRVFLAFSLALTGTAMVYLSAGRRRAPLSSRRLGLRDAAAAVTLVAALAAAGGASELVGYYKKDIYEKLTLWAALIRGQRQVGFDEETRLRSMTSIRTYNAREVALRVQSLESPGYLRGRAYVRFSNDRWSNDDDWHTLWPWTQSVAGVDRPSLNWNLFLIRRDGQGQWGQLTVYPASVRTAAVFMPLGTQVAVVPTAKLRQDSAETLSAAEVLDGSPYVLYHPKDAPPPAGPPPPMADQMRRDCLSLPDKLDMRVRIESRLVLGGCRTTAEALKKIEQYFQANFQYHLGVSIPLDEDPLGYFLSDKPPAHCEMFASAAAIMLRCHGVPTRYVTGFVANERNPYSDYWIARNADAHAWVEAWDDQRGWVLVEATPPAGVPGSQQQGGLGYLWDVMGFHISRLLAMVRLEGVKGLLIWIVDMLGRLLAVLLTGQGLTMVGGLATAIAAWRVLVRRRKRLASGWRRRARTELGAVLAAADRRVRRLGLHRRDDETLARFVTRLERVAEQIPAQKARRSALARWAVGWYRLYQTARYSGAASPDEIRILRSQIPRWFSPAKA